MTAMREDARRACAVHRERILWSPVHLTGPFVAAVVVTGALATFAAWLGAPLVAVLAVALFAALAGAVVEHRVVGSVLAGTVLLLVRPYAPGEVVRLTGPEQVIDAEVVRIGLANTTLCTGAGLLVVPNARMLHVTPQPYRLPPIEA